MNEKQISLLAAFAAARVEFAVVGGVAVNAHASSLKPKCEERYCAVDSRGATNTP